MSQEASERKRAAQHSDRWSGYETNDQIVSVSEKLTPAEMKRFELFESYRDPLLESISPERMVVQASSGSVSLSFQLRRVRRRRDDAEAAAPAAEAPGGSEAAAAQ